MRNIAVYSILILVATVLWGCPYKSSVPLADATEKLNKQILGEWIPKTQSTKENPEYYAIEMRDSLHFDIDHFQYNDKDKDYAVKQYVAWTTHIDNINFMNVQESGQTGMYIYRLDVMGDGLMVLYEVTSNIDERFDDSEKMRTFFQKYMGLSFFYTSDEVELIKKER